MKNSTAAIEPRAVEPADPALLSPEEWAKQKSTPEWAFAGAKQANRDYWVIGRVVSESDFDNAIARVVNMPIGSHGPTPAKAAENALKPRSKAGR